MMKKTAAILICLTLALMMTIVYADTITMTPVFYNPANDIADWHLEKKQPTAEMIQELRHGSFSANVLPINENLLLWYGTFEYEDLTQEESFWLSYDVEMPRSDAYAVAVDSEGKRIWSLRLSDPQSENSFSMAHQLNDGRIMLKFSDTIGEFGTQYYVVSLDGEVQEILPAYKTKDYGVSEMLIPMHNGFFGGGMSIDSGAFSQMLEEVNLTYFDHDLNMEWRFESEDYIGSHLTAKESSGGILLGGTLWPNYIPNQPFLNQTAQQIPIALKLDLNGNVIWEYRGHELAVGSANTICETDDGGAVFLTQYDPSIPTSTESEGGLVLVKLSNSGDLEWVNQVDGGNLLTGYTDFLPYNKGYLINGYYAESDEVENVVLYVSSEGSLLGTAILDKGFSEASMFYAYTSFVTAPDDGVFLSGITVESESQLAGIENPRLSKPFFVNMRDIFQ